MKKSELIDAVQNALDSGTALGIVLMLHMPGGETEVIQNPNVEGKLKHIQERYDDVLFIATTRKSGLRISAWLMSATRWISAQHC